MEGQLDTEWNSWIVTSIENEPLATKGNVHALEGKLT